MSIELYAVTFSDFVLSTAHKAKGLEFSTVKVTDDYGVEPILKRYYGNKPQIAQLPICPGMYRI